MKKFYLMIFTIVTLAGMLAISGCNRPETYIVTFNPNGGSGTMQQQVFTEGEQQALNRNTFTRDGYTFSGWNGNGANYIDGQIITVTADMTMYAQWTSNGTNPTPGPDPTPTHTTGTLNGHDWVDLGLPSGTRWATCNVGATTPEEYGNYYAWGETTPKEIYDWSTYRYYNEEGLTKYCNKAVFGYNGFVDTLITLEAIDDAATVNWGDGWRTPTLDEILELLNNSNWQWTERNGVSGGIFTGINGNSIFLPAAVICNDDNPTGAGTGGDYWSANFDTDAPRVVRYLFFNSRYCGIQGVSRYYGLSVRPVCSSQN